MLNDDSSNLTTNSRIKPFTWNVDVRSYFNISKSANMKFYINVFNLFDHLNHVNVYDDTGRADRTLYESQALDQNTDQLINTIEDWFDNETFYSSPRRIEIGFRYDFN